MKPKAGFLFISEELQCYIMSFLPCRDILRCTSVCKAFRQTYMSSSELQYIVELSGQQLLPVPNTDNHTPISERLQLLRDKAHAWFKFDVHSFETVPVPGGQFKIFTDGHIYSWGEDEDLASIIPILPKPSRQTIQRDWSTRALCSVPDSSNCDLFMDLAQNLIAIAYTVTDDDGYNDTLYLNLRAMDSGSYHPQAAGQALSLSGLPGGHEDARMFTKSANLKGLGRHIALRRSMVFDATHVQMWQLQIWDWRHSTTSSSVLSDTLSNPSYDPIDFCFLGDNRLLVVTDNLKLYSIEDVSQTPQLLACFLSPVLFLNIQCLLPMDDPEHCSQPQMQTMYTSDPKQRLLCLTTNYPCRVYIISTKIFFNLDATAAATPIPWNRWGPSNSRVFEHPYQCKVYVNGNRVLQTFPVDTSDDGPTEYKLHMMDFSPLAVTNRHGLGRVVKEPSTIDIAKSTGKSGDTLTTSLPYVEVVSDRKFGSGELVRIWIDKDRIYLLKEVWERGMAGSIAYFTSNSSELEVIDV